MGITRIAMLLALLGAFGAAESQPPRKWPRVAWRESGRFSDTHGKALAFPQKLVLCDSHVVVLDLDGNAIVALDTALRLTWRYGHVGSGPGEIRMPTDIACDDAGNVWVPDPGNSRLTLISPTGNFLRHVNVDHQLHRVAVGRGGAHLFSSGESAGFAFILSPAGVRQRSVDVPPEMRDVGALQREGYVATLRSGVFGMAFRWSGAVALFEPGGATTWVPGVEPIAFPNVRSYSTGRAGSMMVRIEPGATRGAIGAFATGDTLNVLFVGATPGEGRIIDRYVSPTGQYIGSWRLPVAAESAVMKGRALYALVSEPVPAVLRLEHEGRR